MANRGEGKLLDQFNNPDNLTPITPLPGRKSGSKLAGALPFCLQHGNNRHYHRRFTLYAEQSKPVTIVGLQPEEGSSIPAFAAGLRNICRGFSTLLWW